MSLTHSSPSSQGFIAPDFSLPGVDGKKYTLKNFSDAKALVVVFMCNHCPYVIAVQDRINALARRYLAQGVKLVGINSNDAVKHPEDSFENMKIRAKEKGYVFPYLFDETQAVARSYNAACTPDFYLFEKKDPKSITFSLRYRGRLDDSWQEPTQVKERNLEQAIERVLADDPKPIQTKSSMGCNIKWKS